MKKIIMMLICVVLTVNPLTALAEDTNTRFDVLESTLPQIEELLSQCAEKGIPTDLETVDYTVIKKFINYGRDDINNGYDERAAYVAEKIKKMADNITANLNGYLKGSQIPIYYDRYQTSDVIRSGASLTAQVKKGETGTVDEKEVFLIGYMGNSAADMEILADLGTNMVGYEIGVYDIIYKPGTEVEGAIEKNGLLINAGAADRVVNVLKSAEENNIAVDLLISPHYFPSFVLEEDSSYEHGGSGFGGGGVEWYKERIKEVMSEYIAALIPKVKDSPALMSICLTNEPMFNLMYSEENFAKPMWQAWLEEKFTMISNLNQKLGTSYSDFSAVPMVTSYSQTPIFYVWKEFNEEMFADWHADMAKQIHNIAPDLKVHAKQVFYLSRYDSSYEYKLQLTGTEANKFSEFTDLHGCDAHAYLESGHMYQFQSKLEWYDYLTTIEEKPIINSEDHIIMDRSQLYTDQQAIHVAADMWQGALHGRSVSTAWVYARTYNTDSLVADSLLHRPDVVSEIGKTNLKMNKVADEMVALRDAKAEVGVLFSPASRLYNRNYMNCLYKAYESLLYSGYKTAILDDKAMAAGKWNGLKLIVIPDARYVSADMLNGLKQYKDAGGKIIYLGNQSLKYNDYKQENSASTVSEILDGAVNFNTSYRSYQMSTPSEDMLMSAVRNAVNNNVKIINSETGKELSKTEYRCVDYNGLKLINICRYVWEDVNAEIVIDGKTVEQMYNPVTEENVKNIMLSGYTPIMLMVEATVSQPPENVTAVWNDGAYEISWNIPENSGASKSIVSIVENDAIVYEEELDVNEMEFIYKSEPKSDIRFIVRTVSGTGVASAGIKATKSGLASTVTFDGNDILLKGVTDGGNLVAFTAIPNGGDASSVNDLAAMGSIEVNKDKTFTSKVVLNDKTSVSSDFIIYVGDEKEKQTKYISYINDSDVFSDILVTYNHDGYDIHWNLNRDDVEKVIVSDGSNSVEYSHEEGYTFSECDNIKKTFTITALCSDGGEEKKEISAPIPLGINCRVVDGIVYVRGTAQPADSVQINVVSDENLILAKTVTADEWGGFETNFIIEDSKITSDEKFILQIITKSDMDKTTEFIYTGSLPVHIESEDGKVSFTNYYSKKIEKSQAIVAFYDGEKLAECKAYDISINPGEKIVPDIEYYAQQGYKVKIFLWNGLNAMKPLSRVYAR